MHLTLEKKLAGKPEGERAGEPKETDGSDDSDSDSDSEGARARLWRLRETRGREERGWGILKKIVM